MKRVFLYFVFVLSVLNSFCQNIEEMNMSHWDSTIGLPTNEIKCFAQDELGFLWVGTSQGPIRFDGTNFLPITNNQTHFTKNIEKFLIIEKQIFALTDEGEYYKIDKSNLTCKEVNIDLYTKNKHQKILTSVQQENFIEFMGNEFHLKNNGELFKNDNKIEGVFHSIFKDSHNRLWTLNRNGSISYKQNGNTTLVSLPNDLISAQHIVEDNQHRIWFSLERKDASNILSGGIELWDQETVYSRENIHTHPSLHDPNDLFSTLYDLDISSMFFDKSNNLWIGTVNYGMFMINFKSKLFNFYKLNNKLENLVGLEDISIPFALSNGDVWVGTWGAGIRILKQEYLTKEHPEYEILPQNSNALKKISKSEIFPIFEDTDNNVWVGTRSEGLFTISKENITNKNYAFKNYNSNNSDLISNEITNIFEVKNGDLWISTRKGISVFDRKSKAFKNPFSKLENPNLFDNMFIFSIFQDSYETMWISTKSNGIFKWNLNQHLINHITEIENISTNSIKKFIEESDNTLWFVGSSGLFKWDRKSGINLELTITTEEIGNNAIGIISLLEGESKKLWLGTRNGLFKYDVLNKDIESIDLSMGLRKKSFTQGASKDKNGSMYFGTRNGFYRINPNKIAEDKSLTPLIFTNLKIKGQNYREFYHLKNNEMSKTDISSTNFIELPYQDNTFSIEYGSLDYKMDQPKYFETSFAKENEDDFWEMNSSGSYNWTNLEVGNYTFKVRTENGGRESSLNIIILPPLYRSNLALVIYSIILLILTLLSVNYYTKRKVKLEKEFQEKIFEKIRFKFFLNISHEIRTPLTLIRGGIDRLREGVSENKEKEIERIYKNSERLNRLINEVLDLKKMERSEVVINLQKIDYIGLLENIVDVFTFRENNRKLLLNVPSQSVWIESDKELLETIIYNLISNAIKYSDVDSYINISLFRSGLNSINLSIIDEGIGIKKEEQTLIFNRFYQSDEHLKTGTGIGLAIVKQYVNLLKGTIKLNSEPGKGSEFIVSLPFSNDSVLLMEKGKTNEMTIVENSPTIFENSIVIVDDKEELRSFVREIFEKEYNVFEAENGQVALRLIKKVNPSLIISDVMMPVMDGTELCKIIRSNAITSHIPFIMLTAKTGDESEIDSFNSGVDAFINKPFSQKVLKLRVDKLIEHRQELIKKYRSSEKNKLEVLATNDFDQKFLEKLEVLLENRFSESDLSIEELASEMAMSVSGFFKKIKSITGYPPIEFVRTYRLKKAAHLLKSTGLSITEISENTGFGSQKYFSTSFKKHYDISPLKYRKR